MEFFSLPRPCMSFLLAGIYLSTPIRPRLPRLSKIRFRYGFSLGCRGGDASPPYISQCLPCLLSLALHTSCLCSQSRKLQRSFLSRSLSLSLTPSNSLRTLSSSSGVARDVSGFPPLNRHSKGELRRSRATDSNTSPPIKLSPSLRDTNDRIAGAEVRGSSGAWEE